MARWIKRFLVGFGSIFGVAIAGILLYPVLFPDEIELNQELIPNDLESLALIFHGSGGSTRPDFVSIRDEYNKRENRPAAVFYNWATYSNSRLKASSNARKLGLEIGKDLASRQRLKRIRLIGHSVGGMLANSLCESLRASRGSKIEIELILLDPFGSKSLLDRKFGANNFGKCADFAVAYINTSDAAPSTNTAIRYAYNIDVTDIAPGSAVADEYGGLHYWPVRYYLDRLLTDAAFELSPQTHESYPRGEVFKPSR